MMSNLTVSEIRSILADACPATMDECRSRFGDDTRAGVIAALEAAQRRVERDVKEGARLRELYAMETELRASGFTYVAGVDEVGRGALAGPVTAGAAILPLEPLLVGLNDSKMLSPQRREELAGQIRSHAVSWAVAHVPAAEIDRLGIAGATRLAMQLAVKALDVHPDHVIIDGLPNSMGVGESAVVKGDQRVAAIAAASIVAKVERDRLMVGHAEDYPAFGFEINKGYGTREHMDAILIDGPCVLHRRSFAPCSDEPTLF
ncbi:MAG: ribonuclease HII [Actinomycetota bacterium]|jgi:ribonuclease HII|nr:ribonuclease HII [Actinomycetota bacterium]